ncbi:MAG TPA: hypothetical protein VMG59_11505 [Phycisphaerae bacterium]|nr:hypothetical protein [Phycisphaerae bacterium]
MRKIAEEEKMMRRTMRVSWRCRNCREIFGSENVAYYCTKLPQKSPPTWFFASMTLLDHLRDCRATDFSHELREQYGDDFLNHPQIYEWFNRHAMTESRLMAEEELNDGQ